jgi:hypothetical protein
MSLFNYTFNSCDRGGFYFQLASENVFLGGFIFSRRVSSRFSTRFELFLVEEPNLSYREN